MPMLHENEQAIKTKFPYLWLGLFYHRTHKGKPLTFEHYAYMKDIYLDKNPYIVIQKSTQVGISEYLIVRSIYNSTQGRSEFYVLPNGDLLGKFVKDRFDRSIEHTDYYKGLVKDRPHKFAESIGLKHIGMGSINFAGSNSASAFFSYAADDFIIDELDLCDQTNIEIGDERLSASENKTEIKVSNPSINDYGINKEYKNTDEKKWFIKCSHCGKSLHLNFFEHIVREVEEKTFVLLDDDYEEGMSRDVFVFCEKCHKPIDRFVKGEWVANQKSDKSGYYISKLFSTNMSIKELVDKFEEGLKNETKMQRFYNGDLGLPYISSSTKITFEILNDCKRDYNLLEGSTKTCIIGVDVGSLLNVIISEVQGDMTLRVVFIGTVHDEADIYDLVRQFNVKFGCIDALPETRMSKRITQKVRGIFGVYFGNVKVDSINIDNKLITVERTQAIDAVKEALSLQTILLPQNADKLLPVESNGFSEFYNQMNASTRILDEKELYKWVEGDKPDHYMLAMVYMLIAKRLIIRASNR
jgi:hypothetical protein